jgi:hypothetical protein
MKGTSVHDPDHKHELGHIESVIADDPKLLAAAQEYVPGTPEERRLVRKMDLRLMPILWVMYIFNYIDRTNTGVRRLHFFAFFLL